MRKLLSLALVTLFFAHSAFAVITANEKYQLNNQMGDVARLIQLGTLVENAESVGYTTTDGLRVTKTARVTYDVSTDGGDVGDILLGTALPINALVKRAWLKIKTAFTDSGSGTVALSCETAGDILAADDLTNWGDEEIIAGIPAGTTTTMFDSGTDGCNIRATVAGTTQTAGKLILWVEYVESE